MAHLVETMAYAGEVPWHGLGVPVSNDLTPAQMMQKAGLDWKVQEVDNFIEFNGERKFTGQKSLVRETDGRILTNVGENWHPVQNETAFDFFSEYVLAGDMEMHTAGSLKNGKMIWALAKVKDSFELFKGDQVDSYLLFSNPHQYGKTIDVRFTPIRVVCNNTLTMSLGQEVAKSVSLNHRTAFDSESVKTALGIAHEKFTQYKEVAEFLGSKRFNEETLTNYIKEVFPNTNPNAKESGTVSRTAKTVLELVENQPGAEFAEGSFWQAFNAVTYATDHVVGRGNDSRLASAWFGVNQTRKLKALDLAIDYAESA